MKAVTLTYHELIESISKHDHKRLELKERAVARGSFEIHSHKKVTMAITSQPIAADVNFVNTPH